MNRPSIYAAFGDKHSLFLQATEHYRAKTRVLIGEAFNNDKPLREALMGAYGRALDMYYANLKTPLGCFMLCTVVPDVIGDDELRESLAEGLRLFDEAWRKRIQRAQDEGELGDSMSADSLAKIAASGLYYMSIRSRAGEPRENLEQVARDTVEMICRA
jgi:AcrR family transcriptional regulator